MINAKSPDADRIIMFFEWLFSDSDAYSLLMYGIRDENYKEYNSKIYVGKEMTSILEWYGSKAFKNYMLDRPMIFEPDNYTEIIKKCIKENTVEKTLFDDINSIRASIPEEEKEEYSINYDIYKKNLDLYWEAVKNVRNSIQNCDYSKDLNMLIDDIYSQGGKAVSEELNRWIEKVLSYKEKNQQD